jgi:hypothetical protein
MVFIPSVLFAVDVDMRIKNVAYLYNDENGADWQDTMCTLTYFQDLLQPSFIFTFSPNVSFEAGSGLLFNFDQETKLKAWFPFLRSDFSFSWGEFIIGSLKTDHDLPEPILDPLSSLVPIIRLPLDSTNQYPINKYEWYSQSPATHGCYEYGAQLRWNAVVGKGEIYINWQLEDISNAEECHRERFDVGLIDHYQLGPLPFYAAVHYWHNGGHEDPHPISITEDYVYAAGLRCSNWSLLALSSQFFPNRDNAPISNVSGYAIYGEANILVFDWEIQLRGFASAQLINSSLRYISIEGEPFYRVPAYVGLNVFRNFELTPDTALRIGFVNGMYYPEPPIKFSWLCLRYDQTIQFNVDYKIPIIHPDAQTNVRTSEVGMNVMSTNGVTTNGIIVNK